MFYKLTINHLKTKQNKKQTAAVVGHTSFDAKMDLAKFGV